MSKDTHIEWADSTLNLMMGCDGCELWNRAKGVKHCYAGTLTDRYGGRNGYPDNFETPKLFLGRLDAALKWSDLTGKERPSKPWLNGLPRMIFLNDMGDTFTESLTLDWLASLLPHMAESPHVFMILTKRGGRMAAFSKRHPFPGNFWPGVSVTSMATVARVKSLLQVEGGGVKWISAEPLLGPIDFKMDECWLAEDHYTFAERIGLVIVGGESGPGARPCGVKDIRSIVQQSSAAGVRCFVKQVGSNVTWCGGEYSPGYWPQAERQYGNHYAIERVKLKDGKGGDPLEWPEEIRVREMPGAKAKVTL